MPSPSVRVPWSQYKPLFSFSTTLTPGRWSSSHSKVRESDVRSSRQFLKIKTLKVEKHRPSKKHRLSKNVNVIE
jgi:hypothetical protein